ncbi:hypothetical protein RE432_18435 [Pusillimonas sp. SM2304]|uniref:hypothetical protein n=1 Tax=Pusillimonas sp. SM2304 TaxID=3073241 RepID=UPI0028769111|nr:hypothetical protein [Pusillimonas sp. SM2304]MDS1142416.1 hypothetical protein [Pusillimonas sp. SM2304]
MIKILLLMPALALVGCAHQARQQALEEQAWVNTVCEASSQRPEMEPINDAIPSNALKATIGQLADKRKPNALQKSAIVRIDEYHEPCRAATEDYLQRRAPAAAPMYAKLIQDTKLLWAQLLSDELTFGQFNSERARLASSAQAEAEAAESSRIHQAQQLQAQQYQNYLQVQRNMNAYRPKTTNCYQYGNNVQCTQY